MKKLKLLVFATLTLVLSSCSSDDEGGQDALVERLVDAEYIFTRNAGDIKGILEISGLDFPVDAIEYDVAVWKVTYETTYGDVPVVASGMVYIPEEAPMSSYLGFAHGTITANSEAPSQLPLTDIQQLLYAGMASTGLVTALPDFIGFGSSVEIMHPYYVEEPIAIAVIDQMRAARELVAQEGVTTDNELYLAGYSQGGYVTMATHKYIEEQGLEYFDLQASFPSSGGYDIKGVRDYLIGQFVYPIPMFLAYVEEAYRTYYSYDESFASQFFNPPYDQTVIDVFDGVRTGGEINALLNDTISVLMNPNFVADPDANKFEDISRLFDENSLLDWVPQTNMHMYHGDADATVPYHTSIDTYDHFIRTGASNDIVKFTTLKGADHFTGFVPYLEDFFGELRDMEDEVN